MNAIKVYEIDGGECGGDYGVVSFESKYAGQNVGEVCEKLLNGGSYYSTPEDDRDYFGISAEEPIEESEVKIFMRMRDKQDYDDSKHQKVFLATETI